MLILVLNFTNFGTSGDNESIGDINILLNRENELVFSACIIYVVAILCMIAIAATLSGVFSD